MGRRRNLRIPSKDNQKKMDPGGHAKKKNQSTVYEGLTIAFCRGLARKKERV